ncbi:MAG TPA: HypC/HybG/HupF family hydrogenase formation chaperone [Deltaproteobacteria bacterium]|nr:HypC/HybG/HupF family hydrogenase formation chaperone [Deltaproteobacteria bacterium]
MCIAFPGKVITIDENNFAVIEIGGVTREVSLDIMDEPVGVGDYVLCHAGFAIRKVDDEDARERLDMLREILEA